MLDLSDRAGMRMKKENSMLFLLLMRGYENIEYGEKNCQKFINKTQHLRLGKGGEETLSGYFDRIGIKDSFVFVMDIDDEFRFRNVFWADTDSQAAYEYFEN